MNADFSARSNSSKFRQFRQRDEAVMNEGAVDFADQPEIGFSNSSAVKEAPQDVTPDIPDPEPLEPGFTNAKSVKSTEDKAPAKQTASKRTAANK